MSIKPLHDQIIIRIPTLLQPVTPDQAQLPLGSGLVVPEGAKNVQYLDEKDGIFAAEVVAVGPGRRHESGAVDFIPLMIGTKIVVSEDDILSVGSGLAAVEYIDVIAIQDPT